MVKLFNLEFKMRNVISKFIILILPILCGVFLGFNKAIAYTDEGVILWASGSNIVGRTYSAISNTLGGAYTAVSGVSAKFISIKASPTKKEFVMGIQDTGGTLRVYHSSDGQSWSYDWAVTVGDGNVARFDIAYEDSSGRAMVVYRGRISSGRTTFYYRIWNGSSWTAQSEMRSTLGIYTGNIVGVSMASRPDSNQIGLVYLDDRYYAVGVFWSGTAWSFAPSAITTNSSRYNGFTGNFPPLINASVEFESQSGDMLIVAGQNSNEHMHYITRSSAGVWSSVQIYNNLSGYGDYSKLRASPTTDEIALTSCMMEPSSSKYLCEFSMWNGDSFTGLATDQESGQIRDGDIPTDIFWVTKDADRAAVAVYDNDTTDGLDWYMSTNGGSFVEQTPYSGTPVIDNHEGQIVSSGVIGDPSKAYIVISDENNNVYLKRASFDGTNVEWSSTVTEDTPEVTQGSYPVSSSNFARLGFSLQHAPSTLVAGQTTANTRRMIGAGSTSYIAASDCTDEKTCSGFTLTAKGKDNINISTIKLTNSGTINLAQTNAWQLAIDDDGNPNNGVLRTVAGSVSGDTITFNISPVYTVNKYQKIYLFPKATFGTNPYPVAGDTIALSLNSTDDMTISSPANADSVVIGTPTVRGIIIPTVQSYNNTTESVLSSTNCGAINCGGRLGAGAFAQNIEINGIGFGTTKGIVQIVGTSTTLIASSSIKSWNNTKITFALDSSVSGNTDLDFGTNYGGDNALVVIANSATSSGMDFYLFPQITGITTSANTGANAAKEYASTDSDGVITLNGTRFGSASNRVTILGCSDTSCNDSSGTAYVESWSNTAVRVRVPSVIPDNDYSGDVILTRSFPSGSTARSDIYNSTFYIRPRLISINPISGGEGDVISVNGNHLCPNGCPTGSVGIDGDLASSPAFSSSNNVVIGGVTANYFNYWTDAIVLTRIPSGTVIGLTNVDLFAGGYNAGRLPITIKLVAIPITPSSIKQYSGTDLTQLIPTGGYVSTSTVSFASILAASSSGIHQMRLNVEVKAIGTPFSCGSGSCPGVLTGNWISNTPSIDCNIAANNCAVKSNFSSGPYHFRIRTELIVKGTTYYGSWVSYPDVGGNLESDSDFWVDSDAPIIIGLTHGTPGTNSATISWDTNENTDTLLQINKTGTFTDNCPTSNGCTGISPTMTTSHSVPLKNLTSNTTYYYRVRARDAAGNTVWSPVKQFITLAVDKPAKTLFFHAMTNGGTITENSSASSTFMIDIPEQGVDFKSIFIDVRGNYYTYGVESSSKVTISVNGEAAVTYNFPGNSYIVAPWRIYHRVKNLNLNGLANKITITAGKDTYITGASADVVASYLYTP